MASTQAGWHKPAMMRRQVLAVVLGLSVAVGCSRPPNLESGGIYSVEMSAIPGRQGFAVIGVVSVQGDGCVVVLESGLESRPREYRPHEPSGVRRLAYFSEQWAALKPQRLHALAAEDAYAGECATLKAGHPRVTPQDVAACDRPVARGVSLSPRDACRLGLLRARCGPGDGCLVACIAEQWADVSPDVEAAGGCLHICDTSNWRPPTGWSDCP